MQMSRQSGSCIAHRVAPACQSKLLCQLTDKSSQLRGHESPAAAAIESYILVAARASESPAGALAGCGTCCAFSLCFQHIAAVARMSHALVAR